jgi:2-polyprenyl-3-methyl-5-hydroxy-6-metoxy-1,4-benzoquinol methylase
MATPMPANKSLRINELGFFELEHPPTREELSLYYRQKYYQEARGSYELTYSSEELAYFNNRLQRVNWMINKYHTHKGAKTLLDIGCGEGFALSYFSLQGFSVSGIDFSSAGLEQQNPKFNDCLKTGDLFELLHEKATSGQKYDVLLLQNVLEHVLDPLDLCSILKRLLNDGGIAVITVPNDFSPVQIEAMASGCIDSEFWVCPPDHLNYFNPDSLVSLLSHSGYIVHDLIGDFPVDWFLFHPGSNYIQDSSKGKSAHLARIKIENMLHQNDVSDIIGFYRSAAKLGVGRDLTIVVSVSVC